MGLMEHQRTAIQRVHESVCALTYVLCVGTREGGPRTLGKEARYERALAVVAKRERELGRVSSDLAQRSMEEEVSTYH